MKQDFSDRASFLKTISSLKEATFLGTDLAHDQAARTFTLTLTRADVSSSQKGGFFGARKPAYLKTVVTVRRVASYKQYLINGPEEVYVLDRAEVGRGGQELAFYFRPGDRAVMDVDQIDGMVEDAGRATAPPRKPATVNPIVKQEREAAKKGRS